MYCKRMSNPFGTVFIFDVLFTFISILAKKYNTKSIFELIFFAKTNFFKVVRNSIGLILFWGRGGILTFLFKTKFCYLLHVSSEIPEN